MYDSFKGPVREGLRIPEENVAAVFFFNFAFAWAVSAFAAMISYPLDTIKRVQMVNQRERLTFWLRAVHLYEEGGKGFRGIARFWRGSVSDLVRTCVSGLALSLFELAMDLARRNAWVDNCYEKY